MLLVIASPSSQSSSMPHVLEAPARGGLRPGYEPIALRRWRTIC